MLVMRAYLVMLAMNFGRHFGSISNKSSIMSYYVLMGLEVEMDCLAFTF